MYYIIVTMVTMLTLNYMHVHEHKGHYRNTVGHSTTAAELVLALQLFLKLRYDFNNCSLLRHVPPTAYT